MKTARQNLRNKLIYQLICFSYFEKTIHFLILQIRSPHFPQDALFGDLLLFISFICQKVRENVTQINSTTAEETLQQCVD